MSEWICRNCKAVVPGIDIGQQCPQCGLGPLRAIEARLSRLEAENRELAAQVAVLVALLERFGDVSGIGNKDDFYDAFHAANGAADDLLADLPAAAKALLGRLERYEKALTKIADDPAFCPLVGIAGEALGDMGDA